MPTRRVVLALTLLCLGGCQCLAPVEEDAGVPSALDSGATVDAGLTSACVKASDCHGAFTPVTFCNTVYGDAGYSCLDGQCIVECADQAGTTCAVEHATECLQCPPTASCIPPSCPASARVTTFHVEDAQCRGTSPLAPREEIIEGPSEACGMTLSRVVDGGTQRIGALFLQDARAITANVPLLGGRCNVLELPTGAERLLLDCPLCQVVLGP